MSSIKEIANKAKVSIGTVDRVLHNRGRVAPDTEERIKKIIKDLKYKPNIFARNLKLTKTFHFGVLIPRKHQDSHFWEGHVAGITKAQKELETQKVKVEIFHFDRDSEKHFIRTSEKVLKEKLDGLVIAPVLYDQVEMFVNKIPSSLPYVFIDHKVPGSKYLSFIGQDPFQSGVLSGKLMNILLPQGGTVAIINITPRYHLIDERIKGVYSYFIDKLEYRLKVYNLNIAKAESETETVVSSIISENMNIRGLLLPGGPVARFAQTIRKKRLPEKLRIVGYDLTRENRVHLENGTLDFLISQRPETQGYQGIHTLYRHSVLKQKVQKEVDVPIDIVAKENMKYY
jgi:LacI family transcriptional regulator